MTSTDSLDKQEQEQIHELLNLQLEKVQFDKQYNVIRQTHPSSFYSRLYSLWNYELELSLQPVRMIGGLTAAAVVCAVWFVFQQPALEPPSLPADGERKLIETSGYIYWQDTYEQVVSRNAH